VEQRGVRFAELIWDADEVLWDWAMSGVRLFAQLPKAVFGDFGHREWVAVRPGLLELLWGMRHASIELGHDPDMRIWTSGYPWRLWEILNRIKGFRELLGDTPDPGGAFETHPATHPRVFTRPDYVAVVKRLLDPAHREAALAAMPTPARETIARQLDEKPHDSGFKIPELALTAGREAFAASKVLIDDARRNVRWFVATGRSAVHVKSLTPRIALDLIPNSAWSPLTFLRSLRTDVVLDIADALEHLAADPHHPRIRRATMRAVSALTGSDAPPPVEPVVIDIPSRVLWDQWISPIRELEKAFHSRKKRAW
jgi:hypothetical protein